MSSRGRDDKSATRMADQAPGRETEHRMECMELWGGISETDTAVQMTGLDAQVYSRSYGHGECGGDVYYLSSCASGRISRVLLADVTGHGQAVARTSSALQDVMRRNVNVIRQSKLMERINQEFGMVTRSGGFATAVVATYFSPKRSLTITVAGHPPPLLYRESIGQWQPICEPTPGAGSIPLDLPLGISDASDYHSTSLVFDPGDLLLVYTDAFLEAQDYSGKILWLEGLLELANDIPSESRADVIPFIVDKLQAMSPTNLTADDATIILLQPSGRRVPLANNLRAPWNMLRGVVHRDVGQRSGETS